ncbi:HAD family hydrolase [Exilibacterium tricleocarpae]|uniref:HAD family hydrolase n=2 Tax=Exilibacterium tricleocarpae TaxID=2591008 RepID=A0A545T692_9GAMM|nr:HAD family hydrolase [Exilibacterium tricleocarpae]
MWSGPRNISTAMLRAWENRADTQVWDEPLYGYFLARTGLRHPLREAIMATWGTDWRPLVSRCATAATGYAIHYQKHMTHHLLPEVDTAWMKSVRHAFLIRNPAEVIASYVRKRDNPTLEDLGFAQQTRIFEQVFELTGREPVVLEGSDVLKNPAVMLEKLCARLDVPFDKAMLAWPPGPRPSDGPWAPHWYQAVWASTGFEPYAPRQPVLDDRQRRLADSAEPYYRVLAARRLTL